MTLKKLKTFLLLIFVLSFLGTIAQESSKLKIEELPSLSEVGDEVASLGYAGMVGGVHNDVLLAAGGANFPKGLPWMGGEKVWHQRRKSRGIQN